MYIIFRIIQLFNFIIFLIVFWTSKPTVTTKLVNIFKSVFTNINNLQSRYVDLELFDIFIYSYLNF